MKKFLIIIYILIFTVLTYYVVNLFSNRNHEKEQVEQKPKEKIEKEVSKDALPPKINDSETEDLSNEKKDAAYTITQEDCNNECTNIEDAPKKEYCEQICGLTKISDHASCNNLTKIEKDYCLRNQSVSEKNIEKCSEINDAGIEKQCENRIKEDFMDDIM